jgi:hypothetical protein
MAFKNCFGGYSIPEPRVDPVCFLVYYLNVNMPCRE